MVSVVPANQIWISRYNKWMDGWISVVIFRPYFRTYLGISFIYSILSLTSDVLELFVALKDNNNIVRIKNHFNLYCANPRSI